MVMKAHGYVAGASAQWWNKFPAEGDEQQKIIRESRKAIEPWLSAVFQAEHFNLLVGSGLTTAVGFAAGSTATNMGKIKFGTT